VSRDNHTRCGILILLEWSMSRWSWLALVFLISWLPAPAAAQTQDLIINWQATNPAPSAQTHPALTYNPNQDQLMLVWEDGRADPQGRVDYYGAQANSDIYARLYRADSGQPIGDEIGVATQGEYDNSGRYNNQRWPAVSYDPVNNLYHLVWMQLSQAAALGDFRRTSCDDIAYRAYNPQNHQLGPVVPDVAAYQPPPLTDPWGYPYDWSCQQEPQILNLSTGQPIIWWQDHRQRFDTHSPSGKPVSKDIYAQIINQNQPVKEGGWLISTDPNGARLPMHQEKVAVAKGPEGFLVVWQDERNSTDQLPAPIGFRQIYGRIVKLVNDQPVPDQEVLINQGLTTSADHPSVAYLAGGRLFLVVWEQQVSQEIFNRRLFYALLNPQGQPVKPPTQLDPNTSSITFLPQVVCSFLTCVVIYRQGTSGSNQVLVRRFQANTLEFDPAAITLSPAGVYHHYPTITAGQEDADLNQASFYAAYVRGKSIKLAKLSASLPDNLPVVGDVNHNGTAFDRGDVICSVIRFIKQAGAKQTPNSPYDVDGNGYLTRKDVLIFTIRYLKSPRAGTGACLPL